MTESPELRARLNQIGRQIKDAEDHLKLRGMLHKDHKASADELTQRYQALSRELDDEVTKLEAHGAHIGSLEKTVLTWVNSLNFDR